MISKLRDTGVEVRHRYVAPLYKQPMLVNQDAYPKSCPFSCPFYDREIDYSHFNCPNAEKIAGKMIGLPNHPKLKREELDTITSIIKTISLEG